MIYYIDGRFRPLPPGGGQTAVPPRRLAAARPGAATRLWLVLPLRGDRPCQRWVLTLFLAISIALTCSLSLSLNRSLSLSLGFSLKIPARSRYTCSQGGCPTHTPAALSTSKLTHPPPQTINSELSTVKHSGHVRFVNGNRLTKNINISTS
jgi:hypothetical protein